MIIKFCGLTNQEDALSAARLGAEMIGFNFYVKSPRFLTVEKCAPIATELRRLYPDVLQVGVFVDAHFSEIETILNTCGLDLAQLCGDEPPVTLIRLGKRAFKAIRPANQEALRSALGLYPLRSAPPAMLIDAYRPGEYGGTGHTADWTLAASVAARYPVLLAGGLTAENVAQAVQQVDPWGVDVASGIESAPGIKDLQKMQAFIQAARHAS